MYDSLVFYWVQSTRNKKMQMLNLKLANFTGIVATSVPSGYDNDGLPTGLMFHRKWYDKEKLIKTLFTWRNYLNDKNQKFSIITGSMQL